MTVLRYQKTSGITSAALTKQLPSATFTSVTAGKPGEMVDITVTAGGVNDTTALMTALGYTLFATDPSNTLAVDAAAETPGVSSVLISGGTTLTIGAVSDGQVLSRSGTTVVGTSAGTSFDIRDIIVYDHFIIGSTTTERIGQMGWQLLLTGTGADMQAAGEAGHPGIIDFGAGTVAAGRVSLYIGDSTLLNMILNTTQNQIDMEWLIRFSATALSSANNERFTVGYGDTFDAAAGVELTNGIYCEFNPSLSANFALVTSSASTRTRTATSIAVASATWYRIGISITFPGGTPTATLFINGTSRAANTANFPSTGLGIGARMDANAGTEPRFQMDYVKLTQVTNKET